MGEACDRFWYRGEVYSDQIDLPEDAFGDPPFSKQLKVISRPVYAWWAEVRLTSGRTGWVVVETVTLTPDSNRTATKGGGTSPEPQAPPPPDNHFPWAGMDFSGAGFQ